MRCPQGMGRASSRSIVDEMGKPHSSHVGWEGPAVTDSDPSTPASSYWRCPVPRPIGTLHTPLSGGWTVPQLLHAGYTTYLGSLGPTASEASINARKFLGTSRHTCGRWCVKQFRHKVGGSWCGLLCNHDMMPNIPAVRCLTVVLPADSVTPLMCCWWSPCAAERIRGEPPSRG